MEKFELSFIELWDVLVAAELFTNAELQSLTIKNGISIKTLNDALYLKHGYKDYKEMLGEW